MSFLFSSPAYLPGILVSCSFTTNFLDPKAKGDQRFPRLLASCCLSVAVNAALSPLSNRYTFLKLPETYGVISSLSSLFVAYFYPSPKSAKIPKTPPKSEAPSDAPQPQIVSLQNVRASLEVQGMKLANTKEEALAISKAHPNKVYVPVWIEADGKGKLLIYRDIGYPSPRIILHYHEGKLAQLNLSGVTDEDTNYYEIDQVKDRLTTSLIRDDYWYDPSIHKMPATS